MRKKLWFTLLLAVFCLSLPVGCKKKSDESADVFEEEDEPAEKKTKKTPKKAAGKKAKVPREPIRDLSKPSVLEATKSSLSVVEGTPDPAGIPAAVDSPGGTEEPATAPGADLTARGAEGVRSDGAATDQPIVDAVSPGGAPAKTAGPKSPIAVREAVDRILILEDLNRFVPQPKPGWKSEGLLQGKLPSEAYDSTFFLVQGTSRFASAQVWNYNTANEAFSKWKKLLDSHPMPQVLKNKFAVNLFYSFRNHVGALVFVEPARAMVVSVSCHDEVCSNQNLYDIAKNGFVRLLK